MLWDLFIVILRIVSILPFMLLLTIFMGKRSVGELPVFDFLVVLVLGAVVGADIADPKIEHIHTVVAMIVIALLHKLIIYMKTKHRRFGNLISFEPTIVVYKGIFLVKNMKKIRYSIDNILQMLREQNVFHVSDVEMALVEANGMLSVRLVPNKELVRVEHIEAIGSQAKTGDYEIPIILDGVIQEDILDKLQKDKKWVIDKLNELHIPDESRVFYGAINAKEQLHLSLKKEDVRNVPPIFH